MSELAITPVKLPYDSYAKACEILADIEPIDYFFAKHVCEFIMQQPSTMEVANGIDAREYTEVFHLMMALHCANRAGDVCLSIEHSAGKLFGFDSDNNGLIRKQGYRFLDIATLRELLSSKLLKEELKLPVVFENDRLYLRRYFNFEQEVHQFILNKTQPIARLSNDALNQVSGIVNTLFPDVDDEQDIDWQKVAVANALNKQFIVIAGGPGTGKTFTVTKLLAALILQHNAGIDREIRNLDDDTSRSSLKIALTAPTGKAAQRLSESIVNAVEGFKGLVDADVLAAIPRQAQTIHRLLGVVPGQVNFKHNETNLLDVDVLLVDEVSMVDLPLMARLTRALPIGCRVIFLGDADQLPSVGAGCVLNDIAPRPHPGFSKANAKFLKAVCQLQAELPTARASTDHLTFLLHSRRFDGKGGIGRLAKAVISGDSQESWQLLKSSGLSDCEDSVKEQLRLLPNNHQTWLAAHVKQFYAPLVKSDDIQDAFTQLNKYRILCATRVGEFGVETLNKEVETILFKQGVIPPRQTLYHGKPIMISQNDYLLGLFNGDIGVIWRTDLGHLMAVFERENGEYLSILPSRLPLYEAVYAMTIHKTQGSEFNHAVIVLPEHANSRLLSRELLYTGITRGKAKVSIHANKIIWQQTVVNQTKRMSGLNLFKKGK